MNYAVDRNTRFTLLVWLSLWHTPEKTNLLSSCVLLLLWWAVVILGAEQWSFFRLHPLPSYSQV